MKHKAKQIVASILGWQIRRLRKRHDIKVIAVTGSIGKTSTKLAIAHVLATQFRVNYQTGNYNDIVTVPLVFFGKTLDGLFNPWFWLSTFIGNEIKIARTYPYDVVVVELGTDGPGQIRQFGKYIEADLSVLTAVTPEHMEYFADLDEVAHEEIAVAGYSRQLLVNSDLVGPKYIERIEGQVTTYAIKSKADYGMGNIRFSGNEATFSLLRNGAAIMESSHQQVSEPQLYSVMAAAAVADKLGMGAEEIDRGIRSIPAVSGRMQHLRGIKNSLLIDDSYNSSPEAARAALDTLYRLSAPQKIALLGNMNELGKYSQEEHRTIGEYVDPEKIDLLITLGPDANHYTAAAAKINGVNTMTFDDPVSAGQYIRDNMKDEAIVLIKGSQNRVFAEEAIKQILADPTDAAKLVRQSDYWLKVKQQAFPSVKIK